MAKSCWIIGASHGIGKALASKYYQNNYNIILSARSKDQLIKLKAELTKNTNNDCQIMILDFDVCDIKKFTQSANKIVRNFSKIDLAIYTPALYQPENIFNFNLKYSHQIISTNLGGCINFLNIIAQKMQQQKSGHIALIASIAGYCGLPNSLTYGATKAAMINLAEGIYCQLKSCNINLSLINPGFVATRLTKKNKFYMPFIITKKEAADRIYRGINSNKFEIHFPRRFSLLVKFLKILPYKIFFHIIKFIKN